MNDEEDEDKQEDTPVVFNAPRAYVPDDAEQDEPEATKAHAASSGGFFNIEKELSNLDEDISPSEIIKELETGEYDGPVDEPISESEETIDEPESIEPFLKDEMPTKTMDQIKWYIMVQGLSTTEIEALGYIPGTIRIARDWLAKKGYIKKKPKDTKLTKNDNGTSLTPRVAKSTQVFAKGSPPEAIIEAIHLPMIDGLASGFESGMKFGMSTITLAIRMVQELSAIGLTQVRPLIDMTRTVREGEGAAFKLGAEEAAFKAAQAMGSTIIPEVAEIKAAVNAINQSSNAGGDPMKAMMVRTFEPLMGNLFKRMMPGMFGGAAGGETATGWTTEKEKPKIEGE